MDRVRGRFIERGERTDEERIEAVDRGTRRMRKDG